MVFLSNIELPIIVGFAAFTLTLKITITYRHVNQSRALLSKDGYTLFASEISINYFTNKLQ